jgi:GTPase SAR1 family protein
MCEADAMYKIVLVGNSGVGKSNILKQFTSGTFELTSKATLGVEFAHKDLTIEGKTI